MNQKIVSDVDFLETSPFGAYVTRCIDLTPFYVVQDVTKVIEVDETEESEESEAPEAEVDRAKTQHSSYPENQVPSDPDTTEEEVDDVRHYILRHFVS